jgi:hypothetical protein
MPKLAPFSERRRIGAIVFTFPSFSRFGVMDAMVIQEVIRIQKRHRGPES